MRKRFNRTWRIVLIVLVVLVSIRLALPFLLTRHINSVLTTIPGYNGTVEDVDIHLLQGFYRVHDLRIYTAGSDHDMPFIRVPSLDVSIDWDALLEGSLTGELRFDRPELNFIANEGGLHNYGPADWCKPLKKLIPLDINHAMIDYGKITFTDSSTTPDVNIFLNNIQVDIQNLQNSKDNPDELPSRLFMQATSVGNGQLSMIMKMNVLKSLPDVDLDLKFENVNLPALKDFFKAYADADIENGNFNLYAELAVLNGHATGYVKPNFSNIKAEGKTQSSDEQLRIWNTVASHLLKMSRTTRNQFAKQVPVEDELQASNVPFWSSVWNIFRNTFELAFVEEKTHHSTVTLSEINGTSRKEVTAEKKDKKEIRREKRKERREKRKEKKEKKLFEINKADKRTARDNSIPL
jgi:hypothetical protein